MDLKQLTDYMIPLAEGKRLSADEKRILAADLPVLMLQIQAGDVPAKITTPTGETLRSATRMTAVTSYSLLLARKAFGPSYIRKDPVFEETAKDLLFYIMRDFMNSGRVKGEYCCPTCTLSVLPLYLTKCFKWVVCEDLAQQVMSALEDQRDMFVRPYSRKYADWALSFR